MKFFKLFLFATFCLSSCSPLSQDLITTPIPTSTSTTIPTTTPTSEPLPQPIVIGEENGALTFMSGSSFTGFQMNATNSSGENLIIFDKKFGKIWDYAWSPDGQYVGFLSNTTRMQEKTLYLLDPTNTEVRTLTSSSQNVSDFAWHPDSETIAFSDTSGTDKVKTSIWIVNTRKSDSMKLDINFISDMINRLTWSPNGESLSFVSTVYRDDYTRSSLYIIGVDSQNLNRIDEPGQSIIWSPLENKIGIGSYSSFKVLDLSKNEISELIKIQGNKPWMMDNFTWSPDGKNIAYRVREIGIGKQIESPNSSVNIFSIDTSNDHKLTDVGKGYDNVAWSLDSSQVAFTKCDEDLCGLFTTNIDDKSIREIAKYPSMEISQLKWIPSINLSPSLFPPTPTPIASWSLLPIPPLYDNFESNSIDNDKWEVKGQGDLVTGQSGQYSYLQENGVLEINSDKGVQSEDFGLSLTGARSISQIQAFEAKIKIGRESDGYAFVKMQISADLHDYDWITQCRLGNSLQNQPTFVCDIAKTIGGYGIVYQTDGVSINFDQWYVVRIEIQPNSGAVQYYLDGNLLSTYLPDDVDELTQDNISFNPNIGAWISSGSITAYIDDVRISEKK